MNVKQLRKTLVVCFVAVWSGALLVANPLLATASGPASVLGLGGGFKPVPMEQLATMRGRGVLGDGRIVYFGVKMSSSWQNQSGDRVAAGLYLGIDVEDPSNSVIQTWEVTDGDGDFSQPDQSGQVTGGLSPIAGVGQSIQVSGDGNDVFNGTHITIREGAPGDVPSRIGGACSPCQVFVSPDGASVRIQLPGGNVSQNIGTGGILQQVQLSTDQNIVRNMLDIQVQMLPNEGVNLNRFGQILDSLRAAGL